MGRRESSIELKREAVKLVRKRGVAINWSAKDLGLQCVDHWCGVVDS
jgi:hypothetical protein